MFPGPPAHYKPGPALKIQRLPWEHGLKQKLKIQSQVQGSMQTASRFFFRSRRPWITLCISSSECRPTPKPYGGQSTQPGSTTSSRNFLRATGWPFIVFIFASCFFSESLLFASRSHMLLSSFPAKVVSFSCSFLISYFSSSTFSTLASVFSTNFFTSSSPPQTTQASFVRISSWAMRQTQ